MATTIRRKPKGAPASSGGQFDGALHDEADRPLSAARPSRKKLQGLDLLREARMAAQAHLVRYGYGTQDAEDIASQTIVETWRDDGIDGALLNTVSRRIIMKSADVTKGANPEDILALRDLRQAINDFRQWEGAEPTDKQIDDMANDIRDNWIRQKSKPVNGFQNYLRMDKVRLHTLDEDDLPAALVDPHSPEAELERMEERWEGRNLDSLAAQSERDPVARREQRKHIWSILSGEGSVPEVKASIPAAMQRVLTSKMRALGVEELVRRYDDGERSSQVDMLFLPFRETKVMEDGRLGFREISDREREEVVGALRKYPAYADRLWLSALGDAR